MSMPTANMVSRISGVCIKSSGFVLDVKALPSLGGLLLFRIYFAHKHRLGCGFIFC